MVAAHGACSGEAPAPGAPPFEPRRVVDAFPAITDPEVVAGGAADDLQAEEIVLGVVVAGRARAYPINMLTGPQREIVNDSLGGRAIAATW